MGHVGNSTSGRAGQPAGLYTPRASRPTVLACRRVVGEKATKTIGKGSRARGPHNKARASQHLSSYST